ncbi:MAG: TlpA family protein disulfide reductase [Gemmatimonadetes bacterium]|nr:TlpA family protein disulfide reductase [Gemmatimonadota bacterium]NNM05978.1 TlpA family protein disulfide reductase [Gemmatimonadota bacterium]
MLTLKRSFPYLGAGLGLGLVVLIAWLSRETLAPIEVGGPAPDFALVDLQGNPKSLEDYRGSVLLLNIWATWCTPCKEEMPSMQRLYDEVQDEDFRIVAVSIDRAPPDADPQNPVGGKLRAFADSLGLTFTILHDPEGEISTTYQASGVPESFVLDRDGRVVERIRGPRDWDEPRAVEMIRSVLHPGTDSGQ